MIYYEIDYNMKRKIFEILFKYGDSMKLLKYL
jgi:hypothetical protein